jgi:hypothetical protein
MTPATRQRVGSPVSGWPPGGVKEPELTVCASEIVVSGSFSVARASHARAGAPAPPGGTRGATAEARAGWAPRGA